METRLSTVELKLDKVEELVNSIKAYLVVGGLVMSFAAPLLQQIVMKWLK